MRVFTNTLLAATALAAMATTAAEAQSVQPLTLNGGWSTFYFYVYYGDPSIQTLGLQDITYTFSLSETAQLKVTDGYWNGDVFDFTINGVDQGPTSASSFDGSFIGGNWEPAYNSPEFSHGDYLLGPGNYTVTGVIAASPFGDGAGAVNLSTIPEPGAWAMMLLGLGGLGAMARRRRTRLA